MSLSGAVISLFITLGLIAVSCSDHKSPTSPGSSSTAGRATISGTLLATSDAPAGRGGAAAAEPLASMTVRVASTGQAAQLAVLAFVQVGYYWRNGESLYLHALRVTPNNWLAANNLGNFWLGKQDSRRALTLFREAARMKPDYRPTTTRGSR